MRNFIKTVFRSFKDNIAKLISISAIIFLGIVFISGLGTLMPTIERSVSDSLNGSNAADVIIMGAFTDGDIDALLKDGSVAEVSAIASVDYANGQSVRAYYYPEGNTAVSALTIEGSLPSGANEVAAERSSDEVNSHSIGDIIEWNGAEYTITGIVDNPLIFSKKGETNRSDTALYLNEIYYFSSSLPYYTELHVRFADTYGADRFSDGYISTVNAHVKALQNEYGYENILTLEQNVSYATLCTYTEKVDIIVLIFPVFFILVAALVVSTTMTRTVEEERQFIGCCVSLGMDNKTIISKYALMSAVCCIIASVLGIVVGLYLLPTVIYPAFGSIFFLPSKSAYVQPSMGLIAFAAMLAVITGVTVLSAVKSLKGTPAELMLPKAPKAGKKVFLEKIPAIWKRLAFKYKACIRNILRYKKHFAMTVISVCGSTALVFAGFSLVNRATNTANLAGTASMLGSALLPIAALVIVFAVALCAFVIYNLTNLNIGERKRELATLKVLGYNRKEVAAYIYREIVVMTVIGIIFGIILGCGLIQFVFSYLGMGSLADVHWWSYFAAAALVLAFTGLVDLMLMPKINGINMTESLKSVE